MLLVKEISGLEDDKEKELRSVYNRLERLCDLTNRPWGGWAGLAACQGRQVPAYSFELLLIWYAKIDTTSGSWEVRDEIYFDKAGGEIGDSAG